MSLPDKFIMRSGNDLAWEMEKQPDGLYSCVYMEDRYGLAGKSLGPYTESEVERMVFDAKYTIEEIPTPPCNGQDSDGNPLNYTVDDLQLFQRVVLKNGDVTIVAPGNRNRDHRVDLVYSNNTWTMAEFDDEDCPEYCIAEVYDKPDSNGMMLNPNQKGKLLWKRTEKVVKTEEQAAFKQRQEYFFTQISVVEEKLTSLKQDIEALKASV